MPGNWDKKEGKNDLATVGEERRFGGQGHDRIHGDNPIPGAPSGIVMMGDNHDIDIEITAGQKMISAMSGSLLTSLLGM